MNTAVVWAAGKNIKIILSYKLLFVVTRIIYESYEIVGFVFNLQIALLFYFVLHPHVVCILAFQHPVANNSLTNWILWHCFKHALNSMLKEFWNSVVSKTQANAVSNSVLQLLYSNATQAFSLTMHTGPLSSEWLKLKSDNSICSCIHHDCISGFTAWLPVLVQTTKKPQHWGNSYFICSWLGESFCHDRQKFTSHLCTLMYPNVSSTLTLNKEGVLSENRQELCSMAWDSPWHVASLTFSKFTCAIIETTMEIQVLNYRICTSSWSNPS